MDDLERPALAGRHVLVVEDEYYLADDLKKVLVGLGADVVGPVATEKEAVELAGARGIDFAVLDINLRGTLAIGVADALAERGVPFVFATGYDASILPSRHSGVPVWQKPFQPQDLARALPRLAQT